MNTGSVAWLGFMGVAVAATPSVSAAEAPSVRVRATAGGGFNTSSMKGNLVLRTDAEGQQGTPITAGYTGTNVNVGLDVGFPKDSWTLGLGLAFERLFDAPSLDSTDDIQPRGAAAGYFWLLTGFVEYRLPKVSWLVVGAGPAIGAFHIAPTPQLPSGADQTVGTCLCTSAMLSASTWMGVEHRVEPWVLGIVVLVRAFPGVLKSGNESYSANVAAAVGVEL